MKTTTKNWIKTTLSKFPFVEFDRYIDDTDDNLIEVFGWIKRKDNDRDFIVLEFNLKTKEVYCIATSSAKYSEQISKILGEKHISCKSVKELCKSTDKDKEH